MLNIQDYQRYSGEKKIALMDNSTVSFLEQVERAGIPTKELLKDYDAILIPNWVSEEICDSQYRKNYIEGLHTAGLPIYSIAEESYADLVNGEEANLFKIVSAAASKLGQLGGYLQRYVKKNDPLEMEEYAVWMNRMYQEWPLRGTTTRSGREKKKNAGEISLTILAEVFSWYYPDSESITVYTQDRDSYDYQKSARERLNDVFASKTSIDVSYKSNDTLLCQMFRNGMLSLGQIDTLRCDERVVVYTRSRDDKSTALVAKRTDNQQFKALLQDMNVQIIF